MVCCNHGHRRRLHAALPDPLPGPLAARPGRHLPRAERRPVARLRGPVGPALRPVPRAVGRDAAQPAAAAVPGRRPDGAGDDRQCHGAAVRAGLGAGGGGAGVGSVVG